MLSQVGCAEEDAEVDPQLGYPPVYAKLCRHVDAAGLPMPFTEGPPQRFLPYAPDAEDFQHLKDWDSLFPVVAERERDSSDTRKFAEELWQQLDHLGNAGFDPSKFRVDPYGNVVYWNADPSSPLAWDIDHWFPSSRGGRTRLPNLRIVQWQAYLRKRNRLEFLVPWWDLQHGCSINQFLSAFAAKNAEFRKRSFALFFEGGEDESVARDHVGECRPWPQHFREKKALCGLAAAAIVSVPMNNAEGEVRATGLHSSKEPLSKRRWSAEEEEAVRRGVSKFGPGSWKEIKEDDSSLANRSAAQIKEKFRLMRGVARKNGTASTGTGRNDLLGRQSAATTALQKELRVKIMREEKRREREEELAQLKETVVKLKLENEKERIKTLELESLVKKRKHGVEKQRKLAESQSSYRLCLERVLRDTMHQTMTYKEQARLTQEACNVLIARLDCHKATCEATENDLLHRHSNREALEGAAAGGAKLMRKKVVTQGRDIVDVSSCVSLHDEEEEKIMRERVLTESDTEDEGEDEAYTFPREHQQASTRKSLVRHAIKVAMQVEDTEEAVDMSPWEGLPVEAILPCLMPSAEHTPDSRRRIRKSEETASVPHHQYDADSETAESANDSDFADDEMSPAISKDGACRDDSKLVSELSKFHVGPTSALRDFCTRNSKPGESDYVFDHGQALDTQFPSAGETSRSDSKREVQKDVIMVQTESSAKYESRDTTALYKQEYLDELLQQIRFQIPTAEAKGTVIAENPKMSEGHLDQLLEQVLATHLDNMRRNEARHHQSADTDDERMKEIGKSNLDKWLQALLFKDVASAASSPGRDTLQLHSPALSQISVAAMRESLERARHQEFVTRDSDNAERPKSFWAALLRKLSVKHQSELESHDVDHDADFVDAMKSLLKASPNNELLTMKQSNGVLAEGRRSIDKPGGGIQDSSKGSNYGTTDSSVVWKTERRVEDGVPAHTLDFALLEKRHDFPRPLSDVDEASETESGENASRASSFADPSKPRKSVSGKVAGFVGWKKSS